MASYQKRGKGWNYRIRYKDATGEQKLVTDSGFHTKAAAVAAAAKVQESIDQGADPSQARVLFMDYWDKWIDTYKSGDKANTTEYRYRLFRKHLARVFDRRELKSVTPMEWQGFLNDFAAGTDLADPHQRSQDVVSKLNSYVRGMVKSAINEQVLHTDFTMRATVRGIKASGRVKFLEDDRFALVKSAAADLCGWEHAGATAVYVAAMTGMRVSEVLGLTWSSIDDKRHQLHITRSWNGVLYSFAPTKTEASVRDVEVSDEVLSVLSRYHAEQRAAYLKTGYRDPDGMIFRSHAHKVLSEAACNKALRGIEDDVAIPKDKQITFHGLRHSHVSYLISRGVDIYYLSKRLGHSDITITMKVYGHLLDKQRKQEAEKTMRALDAL